MEQMPGTERHAERHGHAYEGEEVQFTEWPRRMDVRQALGVTLAPVAALAGELAKYALVNAWACKSTWGLPVLHLVALATLALTLVGAAIARSEWRGAGRDNPGDLGGADGRTREAAAWGVGVSLISAWVVVCMWLPQFFLSPCKQ